MKSEEKTHAGSAWSELKQSTAEKIKQIEYEIMAMENDDTVGHTANGSYFTRLRELRTLRRELQREL